MEDLADVTTCPVHSTIAANGNNKGNTSKDWLLDT